jgi:PAS domain S-box-containing protein
MEEALQASEARFRTLAEQIPSATTYVLPLHEISATTYVSPQIEQLTGFTPEDFRADPDLWAKRIHPDDFKEVMRKVAQSHSTSERLETEYRVIRKDGRVIWFRDIADLVRDGNGKPICLVGLNIDITERKRAEETAREAEERFHQMAENVREVFWISDPRMAQILYASSAYEEIWGQPVEDVLHHPESLFEAILPEDRHLMTNSLEEQEKGEDTDIEFRIRRPDGSIRWIRNRAYPIRNEKGEVYRVTGFGEDVTERKKSVEALKIFQQALQSTGDAVGIADPLGRHVYQNRAFYDLFGYSLDELNAAGGPLAIFVDKKEGSRVMETVMAGGSVAHEVEVVDKRGRRFLVFQRADSIKDADGRIVGLIVIHRDITDYKRVQSELQEYANRLRGMAVQLGKAEELGRQRIARELHDGVGQNLTALGISLNILRSRLPTELQAELAPLWDSSLELVQETVQHMRGVMAELQPPVLDDYGLFAALQWYAKRFSERTGITAVAKGEDPRPRLPAQAEASLFRIAQEAMTNVAKHGHATRIDVVMEVRDGAIRLIIADDGVGFDPRSIRGSGEQGGWGLLIMKERAEAANGQFLLESKPGQGTRVIVEIPTT